LADFLVFPLDASFAGIASELSVRLIGAGFVVPGALAVAEDAEVPALYYAEMAGAAGSYGAVLLRDGATLATIPTFAWSGAEFEMSLTAAETQAAVAAAIEAYPVAKPDDVQVTVSGGFLPGDRLDLAAARLAAEAVAIGDHTIDYATSTLTQLDAAGNAIAVFNILDEDGNLATSAATAIKRVRRP